MNNGYLNKKEINQLQKIQDGLAELLAKIPAENPSKPEQCTREHLAESKQRVDELLAWQATARA